MPFQPRVWDGVTGKAGFRHRAERLHEQLDMLQHLRQQASGAPSSVQVQLGLYFN